MYITAPRTCDLCGNKIRNDVYDARLPRRHGQWGWVCPMCFRVEDCKLGIGRGTHFARPTETDDNRNWEKVRQV